MFPEKLLTWWCPFWNEANRVFARVAEAGWSGNFRGFGAFVTFFDVEFFKISIFE
jgi:hypothetical protein